jgi:hypothetical protein
MPTPPILTTEPENFTPGDSLIFTITERDYDARENWNLFYSLRGPQVINFNSTADASSPSSHAINVAATVTKTWVPGLYFWQCRAVNSVSGVVATLRRGRVTFLKNYSNTTDQNFSDLSPAEIALQNLLAYDGAVNAGVDPKEIDPTVMRYQIDGVEIMRFDPEQRIVLIEKYQRMVAREQRAAGLGSGRKPRNKVLIRFTR